LILDHLYQVKSFFSLTASTNSEDVAIPYFHPYYCVTVILNLFLAFYPVYTIVLVEQTQISNKSLL